MFLHRFHCAACDCIFEQRVRLGVDELPHDCGQTAQRLFTPSKNIRIGIGFAPSAAEFLTMTGSNGEALSIREAAYATRARMEAQAEAHASTPKPKSFRDYVREKAPDLLA